MTNEIPNMEDGHDSRLVPAAAMATCLAFAGEVGERKKLGEGDNMRVIIFVAFSSNFLLVFSQG